MDEQDPQTVNSGDDTYEAWDGAVDGGFDPQEPDVGGGDGSDQQQYDPQDEDAGVIDEPDDFSDVSEGGGEFPNEGGGEFPNDGGEAPYFGDENEYQGDQDLPRAVSDAGKVLNLSTTALKVLEKLVSQSGSQEAKAALKTVQYTTRIAGAFTEYLDKQVKKRADTFDDVPVKVPTGGKKRQSVEDEVLAALNRSGN